MAYTKNGIYVAVECLTPKTRKDGSNRDEIGTGDYFSIGLDTWDDDQNAFVFTFTAAGQRIDQRLSSTTQGEGFDTPWNVKTNKYTDKWTAEIFIPFIALRFPVNTVQNWGLQFTRFDRTSGELSTWNPQNPLIEDVVLQYGQLEGLGKVRQKIRFGASFFTDVQEEILYENNGGGLTADSILEQIAIDGRFGINSATTLDFSILPDSINYDKYNLLTRNSLSNIYPPTFKDQVPRPFIWEESGIHDKSSIFEHHLVLDAKIAAKKIPINQGETWYVNNQGQLLNRVQFTTRTKNNIGIIVRNAVYEKNIYSIRNVNRKTIRKEVSTRSNVNQIAIEKCFRNNSWVQVSNVFHHATKGLNGNKTAIITQLRDKTNQFELRSGLKVQTQARKAAVEGSFSLQKINGALVYGTSYQSPVTTRPGLLMPLGSFVYSINPHLLTAFVEKRNYTPKQKYWQNKSRSIALNRTWNSKINIENPLEIKATMSGLNKHFRQMGINASISPLGNRFLLKSTDITIVNDIICPISASAFIVSDYRKKAIVSADIRSTLFPGTNRAKHAFNVNASTVFTPKITMEWRANAIYESNTPALITFFSDPTYIDISDQIKYQIGLDMHIFLSKFCNFNLLWTNEKSNHYDRSLFKIKENGAIEPQNYSFRFPSKKHKFTNIGCEFNWYFTRLSYLTAGLNAGIGLSTYTNNVIRNEIIGRISYEKYYIALLCNLNRT
jgi:hypothetical protein